MFLKSNCRRIFILYLLCSGILHTSYVTGQAGNQQQHLKIFLDGLDNYSQYIKVHITYVDYVRERLTADVHVLAIQQATASNGIQYTINFFGQERFNGRNDTLRYAVPPTVTEEEIRQSLTQLIKLGLVQYQSHLPGLSKISIVSADEMTDQIAPFTIAPDKWHNWVFDAAFNGSANGQETTTNFNVNSLVSAAKITDMCKVKLSLGYDYKNSGYEIDTINKIYKQKNKSANLLVVKSINDHWSAGGNMFVYSSVFSNYKLQLAPSFGIEYNFIPYSQATSKLITLRYQVSPGYARYYDSTAYNKTKEFLFSHTLNLNVDVIQKWGSVNSSVSGTNYFNRAGINNVNINSTINWRVARGLFLQFGGGINLTQGQLNIAKKGATPDQILLQQQQLASAFTYYFNFGIRFTFGSIFNSIVNPRFEHAVAEPSNSNYEGVD